MVHCVLCRTHFNRQTRYCNFYKRTIALADIHRQISCPGYPNRAREKWLLKAAGKEQNPYFQAEIFYQIWGKKK
jgi:hypothetical protein